MTTGSGPAWPDGLVAERACHCLCQAAHPNVIGVCDGLRATETRQVETRSLGAVAIQVCRPCLGAAAAWCQPDDCPAAICGGPHMTIRGEGGAEAVVPAGASAEDIEVALGLARALSEED